MMMMIKMILLVNAGFPIRTKKVDKKLKSDQIIFFCFSDFTIDHRGMISMWSFFFILLPPLDI